MTGAEKEDLNLHVKAILEALKSINITLLACLVLLGAILIQGACL